MPIDRKAVLDVVRRASEARAKTAIEEGLTSPAGAANLLGMAAGLAAGISFLAERINELETRLAATEAGPFKYLGGYVTNHPYEKGNFVTYGGSLFHCNRSTTERPGEGHDWTLCCKRGRDGKDAR